MQGFEVRLASGDIRYESAATLQFAAEIAIDCHVKIEGQAVAETPFGQVS
jgi:hypothetical protein